MFCLIHSMGGIPARNSRGERLLIFMGIIDILQSYRCVGVGVCVGMCVGMCVGGCVWVCVGVCGCVWVCGWGWLGSATMHREEMGWWWHWASALFEERKRFIYQITMSSCPQATAWLDFPVCHFKKHRPRWSLIISHASVFHSTGSSRRLSILGKLWCMMGYVVQLFDPIFHFCDRRP